MTFTTGCELSPQTTIVTSYRLGNNLGSRSLPAPDGGGGGGAGGLTFVIYVTNVLAEDLEGTDAWRVREEEEGQKKPAL